MNLRSLSEPQVAALTDLLVMAMYADGHLASAEEARIHELLGQAGAATDSERDQKLDAAVTRVRQHAGTAAAAQAYATRLAQAFQTWNERRQVLDLVDALVASGSHITLTEGTLSDVVREALKL
jgi:uncharacterized tellurite resistance protein B-like protein